MKEVEVAPFYTDGSNRDRSVTPQITLLVSIMEEGATEGATL